MVERNSETQDEIVDDKPDHAETDVLEGEEGFVDTLVLEAKTESSDNVGGGSVEIDVEQLLAEVEAEAADGVDEDGRVRRRLEAVLERKRRHEALVDFEEYDIES